MKSFSTLRFTEFLLSLIFLQGLFSCNAGEQTPKEMIEYHENGNIAKQYFLKDGKKEGPYLEFYLNGDPKSAMHFQDDKQVGKTITYYSGGRIQEIQYYKDGLRHGGDTTFHEAGTIQMTMEYLHGKKDGNMQSWDTTGQMVLKVLFENDSLVEINNQPVVRENN